jgi:flagellar biosynthesis/type III secretory pathway protein FliH
MNLEKAIKVLKDISRACLNHVLNENISENSRKFYEEDIEAIDTVLRSYNAILTNHNALEEDMDKQYNKGYQDGYNQGYLAGAMERI